MTNSNLPYSRDAYDDLADLFLTDPEVAPPHAEVSDRSAVEPLRFPAPAGGPNEPGRPGGKPRLRGRLLAMMRVNLPVIAGPWLEQAASVLASELGPVALLRERGSHVMLDLIAGRAGQQAVAALRSDSHPATTLESAVRQLRDVMACWAIEAPTPSASGEVDWSQFDEIVLLTGADEAATVAAFAQVKSLQAVVEVMPRLCLIVVGSEDDAARRAGGRISRACEESLGCDVELRAVVRRMQPVPMRHLGRFDRLQGSAAVIARVLAEAGAAPRAASVAAPTPAPVAASVPPEVVRDAPPRIALRPAALRTEAVEPRAGRSAELPVVEVPYPNERAVASARERNRSDGATERAGAPSQPHAPSTAPAATLVSLLPDLRPLDARCPRAPEVELAFDRLGRLHALVEDDGDVSLLHLIAAGDWVKAHGCLLMKLDPWLAAAGGDACAEPVLHLFTAQPRQRRVLAEGSLRVHILVRDERGCVVAHLDLN